MGRVNEHRWPYRDLIWLVILTLVVRTLTAVPMRRPGYMDAAYYIDGALSLYEGRGFNDPFIWNYLDDPADIPHPSHLYWMPLSSILAYLSFLCLGPTYRAAQVPFALLSSLLPLLSFVVAYDVSRNRRHALCAGLFTTFSGFYLAYWVTPDNFAPFALAGALCLWAIGRGLRDGKMAWFALSGAAAGLAHLARADGALLLIIALLVGVLSRVQSHIHLRGPQLPHRRPTVSAGDDLTVDRKRPLGQSRSRDALRFTLLVLCYLLVMGPWFARNWRAIGSPLATSGTQTIFLTDYDDLFSYGKPVTARTYLAWGWGNIIRYKIDGAWVNLRTVLFVGWMIFAAPCGLIGVWRLWRRVEFRPTWVYGIALYLTMSLVFTFAGWRGGMLHSLVALLPALYAAAMEGLDAAIVWIARRRQTWRVPQAQRIFSGAFVGFAILLSVFLYGQGLDKFVGTHPYDKMAAWMDERVPSAARIMVNDPATFYYYSRRPCLSIPNADRDTIVRVMARYGARYLILDRNNPSVQDLYRTPHNDPRLVLIETFFHGQETAYLFELVGPYT